MTIGIAPLTFLVFYHVAIFLSRVPYHEFYFGMALSMPWIFLPHVYGLALVYGAPLVIAGCLALGGVTQWLGKALAVPFGGLIGAFVPWLLFSERTEQQFLWAAVVTGAVSGILTPLLLPDFDSDI